MSRPGFTFRPAVGNEDHQRAWELLMQIPQGRRNSYIVRAILQVEQNEDMESLLRRIIREELAHANIHAETEPEEPQIRPDLLDFLASL